MNSIFQIEVSDQQRDVLLRGLRFVRRSTMLDVAHPIPESDLRRDETVRDIENLMEQLLAAPAVDTGPSRV